MRGHAVADHDGFVAIGHIHMHLRTADQLLAGQQLVVGQHLPVAGGLGDLHLGGNRQRHRTRRDHTHAEPRGGVDEDPAMPDQFGAQPLQGADHPGVHLDHAALQLGDPVVGKFSQQFGRACRQPPRLQIDKVKLLFNPEGPRRLASHAATIWAGNYLPVN